VDAVHNFINSKN